MSSGVGTGPTRYGQTQAAAGEKMIQTDHQGGKHSLTSFPNYSHLPNEVKVIVISNLLISPSPLVDLNLPVPPITVKKPQHFVRADQRVRRPCQAAADARLARSSSWQPLDNCNVVRDGILYPAVLRASSQTYEFGIKLLYHCNTFQFWTLDALVMFSRWYAKAAERIENVAFVVTYLQRRGISCLMDSTEAGPIPSTCYRLRFCSYGSEMATQQLHTTASRFSNLKSLTIEVKNWEQKEDVRVEPDFVDSTSQIVQAVLTTQSNWTGEPIYNNRAEGMFRERIAQPVRLLAHTNLHRWIQYFADMGWQAAKVNITGLEAVNDQTLVRGLIEVLKEVPGRRKGVEVDQLDLKRLFEELSNSWPRW